MDNDIKAAEPVSKASMSRPRARKKSEGLPISPSLALNLIFIVVIGFMFFSNDTPDVDLPADLASLNPEEQSEARTEVLKALEDLMVLPSDTEPVLAVVSDAETLRAQQAFYANAEDGDALLIFQSTQQAVIYRPGEHKIVNAGSLIVNQ